MEITTITASYSRKLNHSLYGGAQYEGSDHFCSLTAELDVGEGPIEAQRQLSDTCRELVEKDVEREITSFAGGVPPETFYTYLRDLVARRPIDAATYERCNARQKAVLQAAKRGLQMQKRDDLKSNNE